MDGGCRHGGGRIAAFRLEQKGARQDHGIQFVKVVLRNEEVFAGYHTDEFHYALYRSGAQHSVLNERMSIGYFEERFGVRLPRSGP